jgi:uncharacterized protein YbaP (TraB family)
MRFNNTLLFSLFITLSILSINSYAKSSVWKISKDGKYFYLGGTIHLLNPSDHPLPDEFTRAYKDSHKLIFETDIAESKSPIFQQQFLAAMTDNTGKTLPTTLNQETYRKLQKFLASRNIPIQRFTSFRPWAVGITLTLLEYQRLGMSPDYGVEEYFYQLATMDNKALGSLESLKEQISFLESMDNIEPNLMVNYTLRDLEKLPDLIHLIKSNWRNGDIEAFTDNAIIVQMKTEFPELYNTLLTNRNTHWMQDIAHLNNNDIIEFVLVGALHLNGEEGLLHQLRLANFEVVQL